MTRAPQSRWAGYAALLGTRLRELQREREVVFWVFVFPLMMAIGLGIAFRETPPHASRVAVVGAPAMAAELRESSHLLIFPVAAAEARDGFRLGRYDLVVVAAGGGAGFTYDPARPDSVLARGQAETALEDAAGATHPVAVQAVASTEPGARYIDFLIPGLLGMNLMNSGMWGVGFALVEMRQRKLLKRLAATPMRRGHFLAALMSSRLLLMLVELGLLLSAGIWIFHMRVVGNAAAIVAISALGAIAFGGLGLLVAARATKIESVSGLMNAVMMPMWVLSGVFFSYERFPKAALPLLRLLPLTALNDALRATILEGAPWQAQWGRLAVLGAWGGACFLGALGLFRWT